MDPAIIAIYVRYMDNNTFNLEPVCAVDHDTEASFNRVVDELVGDGFQLVREFQVVCESRDDLESMVDILCDCLYNSLTPVNT